MSSVLVAFTFRHKDAYHDWISWTHTANLILKFRKSFATEFYVELGVVFRIRRLQLHRICTVSGLEVVYRVALFVYSRIITILLSK